MGIFDIQTPRRVDPRWTLIAELAGVLAGTIVSVALLYILL